MLSSHPFICLCFASLQNSFTVKPDEQALHFAVLALQHIVGSGVSSFGHPSICLFFAYVLFVGVLLEFRDSISILKTIIAENEKTYQILVLEYLRGAKCNENIAQRSLSLFYLPVKQLSFQRHCTTERKRNNTRVCAEMAIGHP